MSVADKLTTVAENMPKVYEAGKDTEHKAFWDSFVPNSSIGYAPYRFAGAGWNNENFRPNKNLIFRDSVNGLFREGNITNLKECLNSCDVTLDLSRATNLNYAFAYGSHKYLPKISVVSARNNIQSTFSGTSSSSYLIWIDEVEVAETSTFSKSFDYCKNLEHAIFTGVLATNGLDLHWSTKLDKESLVSIIKCLKPGTESRTVSLSLTAVNNAFTEEERSGIESHQPTEVTYTRAIDNVTVTETITLPTNWGLSLS